MTDSPLFREAVEAMTVRWPKGNPTAIEATALLETALPFLRRMVTEENAQALEAEAADKARQGLHLAALGFPQAAAFLRTREGT